jgi:hypothetical protein
MLPQPPRRVRPGKGHRGHLPWSWRNLLRPSMSLLRTGCEDVVAGASRAMTKEMAEARQHRYNSVPLRISSATLK